MTVVGLAAGPCSPGFAKTFRCYKVAGEEQAGSTQARSLTIGNTPILSGGADVPDLQA
jgi:hypothetical protein